MRSPEQFFSHWVLLATPGYCRETEKMSPPLNRHFLTNNTNNRIFLVLTLCLLFPLNKCPLRKVEIIIRSPE